MMELWKLMIKLEARREVSQPLNQLTCFRADDSDNIDEVDDDEEEEDATMAEPAVNNDGKSASTFPYQAQRADV